MATLTITLPDSLKAFVDHQVQEGGFQDPSAYFQVLLGETWKAQKKTEFEANLLERVEAMEQGDASEMTAQDWDRLRREYLQRHGMKASS